jgi:phosphoribosylanthranilate isomerase
MTRVKICGVRSVGDGRLAAAAGADAIGVLVGQVHPSDDFVSVGEAAAILAALPPLVSGVLVSHLEDPASLLALAQRSGARTVQVHGAMDIAGLAWLRRQAEQPGSGLRILRAVPVMGRAAIEAALAVAPLVDAVVADTANPRTGQVGGTGIVHDWQLSAELRARLPVPLILAGGLTAANVGEAIARVRPYAVDVNSGVKGADGFKDPQRLRAFLNAVRRAADGPEERVHTGNAAGGGTLPSGTPSL